jgi:hypothetical protein
MKLIEEEMIEEEIAVAEGGAYHLLQSDAGKR